MCIASGFKHLTRSSIEAVSRWGREWYLDPPGRLPGDCYAEHASNYALVRSGVTEAVRSPHTCSAEAGVPFSFFEHELFDCLDNACKGLRSKKERAPTPIKARCPHSPDCSVPLY